MDKEEMKLKVKDLRKERLNDLSKVSNLMNLNADAAKKNYVNGKQVQSQFSQLTARDNAILRKKRKLLADDKLKRLKFQMMAEAKEYKKQ